MRPVIVVGAGPVGLSLALGLARRGIEVEVLEAAGALSDEARASTFHPPTLEMFEAWGVVEAVLARGLRVDRVQFWERETRSCIASFDYARIAGDTRYPFRLQCPQDRVTRVLLAALLATGRARVRFGHRVDRVIDHGSHVEAQLSGEEVPPVMEASWLCGADGAHSAVRRSLGLAFEGHTFIDRFLLIATDLALSRIFPGMGPVAYVFDPHEWVIVMSQPERVRVIFRLRAGEDADLARSEPEVRARIGRFVGGLAPLYSVSSTSVYTVHQRVAERFRVGRVLLLGDAAHINNPSGGMGMNSGIHDAWVLCERLAAVLAGGPEALLDAYAEERRRAAVEAVQRDSASHYQALTLSDEAARRRRNRELAATASDVRLAREYMLRASMLLEAPRPRSRGAGVPASDSEPM